MAAADDKLMIPFLMKNLPYAAARYETVLKKVEDKSNIISGRWMEREMREFATMKHLKRALQGKKSQREIAMLGVRVCDRITVCAVWLSAYEVGKMRGLSEEAAINKADSIITRTQPMAGMEDLPAIFRGGSFQKVFTTFQNQINQNYNYWAYDIIGARKQKRINNTEMAYRILMGHVMPAFLMGVIGRGRLPDKKEMLKDQFGYLILPIFFFGTLVNSIIKGYGTSGNIAMSAFEDVDTAFTGRRGFGKKQPWSEKSAEQKKKAIEVRGKAALRAAAKFTPGGLPVLSPLRTMDGAIDLLTGETGDFRRLLWSEYAMKRDEQEEPYQTSQVGVE